MSNMEFLDTRKPRNSTYKSGNSFGGHPVVVTLGLMSVTAKFIITAVTTKLVVTAVMTKLVVLAYF